MNLSLVETSFSINESIFSGNKSIRTMMRLNWIFLDNLEDFLMSLKHLDCFPSHFQPFSLIVGSLKKTCYRPTDRHTDGQTDPLIEMCGHQFDD